MTKHQSITKRFGDKDRVRLENLCRRLGTDNVHEAEIVRGAIVRLVQSFGKIWDDLVTLLSGGDTIAIDSRVAADIVTFGDPDLDRRTAARQRVFEFLERHRKNWNDLIDALMGVSPAPWLGPSTAPDPKFDNTLLIGLIIHVLHEYVELKTENEYLAVALWALHTHVYNEFMMTPRLALRSPVAGCGKTQLVDVLMHLAARAEKFDSITTAAICRLIDRRHPTLMIDEADNLGIALQPNGKLRAVFNSGHRHGGKAALMERDGLREFSTFAPLLVALPDASGGLPRTLDTRCITLMMHRSSGVRKLKRMDPRRSDAALIATYEQILQWRKGDAGGHFQSPG